MIILRQKEFGLFDWIFKKSNNDSNKLKNEDNNDKDLPKCSVNSRKILLGEVSIEDVPDVWPGLVVLGIAADDTKEDGGWGKMFDWMKSAGFFDNPNPILLSVKTLKDNVNGSEGAHAYLMTFDTKTKINSSTRLAYGRNFKWPDDFYFNYRSWYK